MEFLAIQKSFRVNLKNYTRGKVRRLLLVQLIHTIDTLHFILHLVVEKFHMYSSVRVSAAVNLQHCIFLSPAFYCYFLEISWS